MSQELLDYITNILLVKEGRVPCTIVLTPQLHLVPFACSLHIVGNNYHCLTCDSADVEATIVDVPDEVSLHYFCNWN